MNHLFGVVGILAVALGIFFFRHYEEVHDFFRTEVQEMTGDRLGSKKPRPEIMRVVAIGWIAMGILFVVVSIFHR